MSTPGPWRVNKYGGIGAGEFGTDPVIINSDGWDDGTEADIRLIAAAPDLLDFVRQHFEATVCICKFETIQKAMGTNVECSHCDAGRLIAKAEGR